MLNPDDTIENSLIHITAETKIDKNIAEADLIINWVKPKIEIKNNPNNGIINYTINQKIEYNLTFDITSEKSVDYDFKPDWAKCTYEIQNWDPILNNKITYEYTNGSFYISGILNEIIETEFKLIIKYPFAKNREVILTLKTKVPKLKVSGYKDTEYDKLSEFNDTYTIKYISESQIIAEAGDSKSGIGKYINIDYYPQNTDYEWWNCDLNISTADAEGIRYQDTTLRANSNGDLTTVNSLKFKEYKDDDEPILVEFLR